VVKRDGRRSACVVQEGQKWNLYETAGNKEKGERRRQRRNW